MIQRFPPTASCTQSSNSQPKKGCTSITDSVKERHHFQCLLPGSLRKQPALSPNLMWHTSSRQYPTLICLVLRSALHRHHRRVLRPLTTSPSPAHQAHQPSVTQEVPLTCTAGSGSGRPSSGLVAALRVAVGMTPAPDRRGCEPASWHQSAGV